MSLKELIEGECSRQSALTAFASHFVSDKSYRDEGLQHPFQDTSSILPHPEQLVDEFLIESNAHNVPKSFRMDSLLQEMREIESSVSHYGPVQAPGVAALAVADPTEIAGEDLNWHKQYLDLGLHFDENSSDQFAGLPSQIVDLNGTTPDQTNSSGAAVEELNWAEQYLESGKHFDEEPNAKAVWKPTSDVQTDATEEYQLGFGPKWAEEYLDPQGSHSTSNQPYDEFSDLRGPANALLESVHDPKLQNSKFMKFMQQVGDGELSIQSGTIMGNSKNDENWNETAEKWADEYVKIAKVSAADEGPFGSQVAGKSTEAPYAKDFWKEIVDAWDENCKTTETVQVKDDVKTETQKYTFDESNPVLDCENPLEKGKERLAAGDLIGAILYFEAACNNDPNNAEAWLLLGTSQAENEQDPAAITCLTETLKLDPNNLNAMMALAVSLTNENYPNHACYVLQNWLAANPKYQNLVVEGNDPLGLYTDKSMTASGVADISNLRACLQSPFLKSELFTKVQNLYIEAARQHPTSVDPDIQCGLGVIFNMNHDIDKAVDCFRAALQVKQNDFQLWNRLGATLANGSRSEEAVHAYRRALQLFPGFIRARYNLGITCCNLQAMREAAEHFLVALNQQAAVSVIQPMGTVYSAVMSDNIWNSLKLVITLMDDRKLIPAVDNRDLETLKVAFGID